MLVVDDLHRADRHTEVQSPLAQQGRAQQPCQQPRALLCEGGLNLCVAVSTVKIIDHQRPDVIEAEYTEINEYQ